MKCRSFISPPNTTLLSDNAEDTDDPSIPLSFLQSPYNVLQSTSVACNHLSQKKRYEGKKNVCLFIVVYRTFL
jgi:hypothetical protein